ncbi:MAG: hypothetical protein ACXACC_11245, partial [Promethearchaeota archaeon]
MYDPKTDTWSTETPMPITRHGMSVSVVNDKIYCIGGGEKPFYSFGNINLVYTPNNHPPMKPNKIEGKLIGRTQTNYRYITETYDADNDQLYYFFDWGDGNNSGWLGPNDSGVEINASYSWNVKGK